MLSNSTRENLLQCLYLKNVDVFILAPAALSPSEFGKQIVNILSYGTEEKTSPKKLDILIVNLLNNTDDHNDEECQIFLLSLKFSS